MFYHHVLAWKACYTYFSAVLFKPTSRTRQKVSINSPSGEGGGLTPQSHRQHKTTGIVSINSPSGEGGRQKNEMFKFGWFGVSINSPSGEGGGSYVFKPRHSKAFRPPNRRTPLTKQSK
jgi:hypothetical protein